MSAEGDFLSLQVASKRGTPSAGVAGSLAWVIRVVVYPDVYADEKRREKLLGGYQKSSRRLEELNARWEAAVEEHAAAEAKAWMVIPDRQVIDRKLFNRIQVAAEIEITTPDTTLTVRPGMILTTDSLGQTGLRGFA